MTDDLLKRVNTAMERVGDLASGKRKWRMCVPVQADDDDVLLTTTIRDLAARVRELEADNKRLSKLVSSQGIRLMDAEEAEDDNARLRALLREARDKWILSVATPHATHLSERIDAALRGEGE